MRVILLLTILLALSSCLESRVLRVSKQKISRSRKITVVDHTRVCGTGWGSFTQWDAAWKGEMMGTKTIGAVGCAMTSVCNALKSRIEKLTVDGAEVDMNPKHLNSYLKANGGYVGNLIKWAAVDPIGLTVHMKYRSMSTAFTFEELKKEVEACAAVIANVRGGGHWVLLTGAMEGEKFTVSDPGFATTEYALADIKRVVYYDFKEDSPAVEKIGAEAQTDTPPAEKEAASAAPVAEVPVVPEKVEAEAAAISEESQPEIELSAADIELLKEKNGGSFVGEGPIVAAGGSSPLVVADTTVPPLAQEPPVAPTF